MRRNTHVSVFDLYRASQLQISVPFSAIGWEWPKLFLLLSLPPISSPTISKYNRFHFCRVKKGIEVRRYSTQTCKMFHLSSCTLSSRLSHGAIFFCLIPQGDRGRDGANGQRGQPVNDLFKNTFKNPTQLCADCFKWCWSDLMILIPILMWLYLCVFVCDVGSGWFAWEGRAQRAWRTTGSTRAIRLYRLLREIERRKRGASEYIKPIMILLLNQLVPK